MDTLPLPIGGQGISPEGKMFQFVIANSYLFRRGSPYLYFLFLTEQEQQD